nr:MAG TPA: hypothetical protein [Crassvirales sp.]
MFLSSKYNHLLSFAYHYSKQLYVLLLFSNTYIYFS